MSENQSLKEKTAKGLFWGGFSNGIQQLLNLLFGIFLARLLTPADYGMVGMLAIFSLIASSIQESGFTAALVNKKEVKLCEEVDKAIEELRKDGTIDKLEQKYFGESLQKYLNQK